MTWQRYTNPVAVERMAIGRCPECGNRPEMHTGAGLGCCSLTDTGVAGRIWQYEQDQAASEGLDEAIRAACLPNLRKAFAGEPLTAGDIEDEQAALDVIRGSWAGVGGS